MSNLVLHIQALLHAGRIDEARVIVERLTRENPTDMRGWMMLGAVFMKMDRPLMAVESLRKACDLAPGNRSISNDLCNALIQAGQRLESLSRYEGAVTLYREAVELKPESTPARLCLGQLLSAEGLYEDARSQLRTVLHRQPDQPDARAALALSYEYQGDYTQAMSELRLGLEQYPVSPSIALAYAKLARHFGEESAAIALLDSLLAKSISKRVECDIHFALGELYDATSDYDRAIKHYRSGNHLLNYHYEPAKTRSMFQGIIDAFSVERHGAFPRSTCKSELPVFIVGMPRSGTTLVEQILASHSSIYGAGERNDIARIVHALGGVAPSQDDVLRFAVPGFDHAAQGYLDKLMQLAPGAERVIDKMPHNFLALGYIDLMFPACRIVHCVRDPRDTCLSIWFQQMTANHPYTNDLNALADYYRHYQELMRHWKKIIRVPMLEVRYEDLVGNAEQQSHQLVEFCGLAWDEQCLRFHENDRVVSTPTYDDVRRPVHAKSVDRWRNYERHLGALADLVVS